MDAEHKAELENNVAVTEVEQYESDRIGDGWLIRIEDTATPILNGGITQLLTVSDLAVHEIYHRNRASEYHVYAYPRNVLDEFNEEARVRHRNREESN